MFNKKGLKCFGLLSLFSITFGLSLNASFDVNALKHDVQYMPIASDTSSATGYYGYTGNPRFSIYWMRDYAPSTSSFRLPFNHYFTSQVSNGKCTFVNFDSRYYTTPSYQVFDWGAVQFDYGFDSYRYDYSGSSDSPIICQQTVPFGTIYSNQSNITSHPNFDDSSLVNIPVADRPPYLGLSPYYYDYDSVYFHDNAIDTNTGISYNSSLKASALMGFAPNKFLRLTIPLGRVNEDVTGPITTGRSVKLEGVFDFSGQGNYFNWGSDLSNLQFQLNYYGRTEAQSVTGITSNNGGFVPCSVNLVSLPADNFNQLQYSCEFISDADYYNGQLYFSLYIATQTGYIWDSNADWSFGSTWFITDNDDTPGGTWGTTPTGNNLSSAPGSAESLIPSHDDFFSSLTNLFTFGFFNPFAPIFQMFSDNNSCASIPTIAGMIHSEETEVCPWFNSSIRNLVTPVLGLSSMMLVFGFAVRWLGSSSGNLFEDSRHEEVSNQGGRWGHFRKRGY